MAKIPKESTITAGIMRFLKTLRPEGWFFKVWGSAAQRLGVPDIVGVYRGRFVGLEVKRPSVGRTSPMQLLTLDQIRAAGGVGEIVTSTIEAQAVLGAIQ